MKRKIILSNNSDIDWSNIDWSKSDLELSEKLELPVGIFFLRRRQFISNIENNSIPKYKNIYSKRSRNEN